MAVPMSNTLPTMPSKLERPGFACEAWEIYHNGTNSTKLISEHGAQSAHVQDVRLKLLLHTSYTFAMSIYYMQDCLPAGKQPTVQPTVWQNGAVSSSLLLPVS
jgi:hypothetical protein